MSRRYVFTCVLGLHPTDHVGRISGKTTDTAKVARNSAKWSSHGYLGVVEQPGHQPSAFMLLYGRFKFAQGLTCMPDMHSVAYHRPL